MTEHVLVWHPKGPGAIDDGGDDQLRLIGMPTGLVRPAREALAADKLTPAARDAMQQALDALRRHAEGLPGSTRVDLQQLSDVDKATVADMLGEGDVWAKVGIADRYYRIVESVLAGLWRLESSSADGTITEWIEVGAVPQPIVAGATGLPRAQIEMPSQLPPGAMNVLPLLTELQERSLAWRPGGENHVINFTLLPITEVDAEVLTAALGQVPLVVRSLGYGSSRVFATGLRNVWAVQYVNSMGNVILDTLEVGGVPVAVLAAREDFEDSAQRLAELLQAYAP